MGSKTITLRCDHCISPWKRQPSRLSVTASTQATVPTTKTEPLRMSTLPSGPWKELSMDFAELPTGDYLLVLIDDYSRFPMVEIIKSTSSRTVIPCLDKIFSEYGIPEMLRSDNGPPFNGNAFREFANYLGFLHRKITPYWPRANGEAERFMRTIKKAVNAALIEDSEYVTKTFLEYLPRWKKSSMMNSKGKQVKNADIISAIESLVTTSEIDVYWNKVKGHSKENGQDKEGNDQADTLAKNGNENGQKWELDPTLMILEEVYYVKTLTSDEGQHQDIGNQTNPSIDTT
ncbi:hypothetical protein QZH41_013886, partial [Actinostola sp. cb2023]